MTRRSGMQASARAGASLFALVLLFSAVAKSLGPRAAAAGLLWTHLGQTERVAMVLGASFLESLVGGLLLVGGRCRPVLWAGASLAAALLVLHAIGMAMASSGCGCFGDVAVPDGVSLGALVLGFLCCSAAVRSAAGRSSWMRFGVVLPFAIAVPMLAAPALSQSPASAEQELRRTLAIGPSERALVIVGTWSCNDCQRALQDALRRAESGERLFFATRRSEQLPDMGAVRSFVHAPIPDHLWWHLAVPAPPRLVRFEPAARGVAVSPISARALTSRPPPPASGGIPAPTRDAAHR